MAVRGLNDYGLKEKALESSGMVAVAFLAHDSVPCGHFVPELAAVSERLEGKVTFFRIDVVENPMVTDEMGVEAVPTLVVFRDGEEIARYEGPYSREALEDRLTNLMAGKRPS